MAKEGERLNKGGCFTDSQSSKLSPAPTQPPNLPRSICIICGSKIKRKYQKDYKDMGLGNICHECLDTEDPRGRRMKSIPEIMKSKYKITSNGRILLPFLAIGKRVKIKRMDCGKFGLLVHPIKNNMIISGTIYIGKHHIGKTIQFEWIKDNI